jgi:hypothetical protein
MIQRGYALSSAVDDAPITPEIASALLAVLRQIESANMWLDLLTSPATCTLLPEAEACRPALIANAAVWGNRERVDFLYDVAIGAVDPDPTLSVIQLVPALPPGTPPGDIAYHTVDAMGRPLALISYVAAGSDWVAAAAHELEDRVNPTCLAQSAPAPDGTTHDLESADEVEGSDHVIGGISVANHVGPRYFGLVATGALDIAGAATKAFGQLLTGYHDGSAGIVMGEEVGEDRRNEVTRNGPRGKAQRKLPPPLAVGDAIPGPT